MILDKKIFIKLFIICSYIICWLSISTSFNDLLIFKYKIPSHFPELDFFNFLNFMRHFLVYVCFLLSLSLIMFTKIKIFSKKNIVYLFFCIYLALQIPGLIFTYNLINNISFVISGLTVIFIVLLVDEYFTIREKNIFIFISFIVLLGVFLAAFSLGLRDYFAGEQNLYGGLKEDAAIFAKKDSPRSSGISRTCLILILMLFIIENLSLKKKSFIILIFNILFISVIFLYQSRTNIFLVLFSTFLIFVYLNKINFKNIFKYLTIYILIPIVISFSLMTLHSNKVFNKRIADEISYKGISEFEKQDNINIEKEMPIRNFSDFSSGRINDWQKIFYKLRKDNHFFGYGAQADRFLINQSASNGLIYALSSSGIIGLIFFISFSFMVFLKSLKKIVKFQACKFNIYLNSLIVFIILLRSILETSYAVFGIDLMILITSFSLINNSKDTSK